MFTILFSYTAAPEWMRLSRAELHGFNDAHLRPVLERHTGWVSATFCDSQAFSARGSDFVIFETARLEDYSFLIEELRDTPLFTVPYVTVNDIIFGLQDGFERFEASKGEAA